LRQSPLQLPVLTGRVNWNRARYTQLNNIGCYANQTVSMGCNQFLWVHHQSQGLVSGWQPPNSTLPNTRAAISAHTGGLLASFVDGHVSFISNNIDMRTYEALIDNRSLGEGDSDKALWGPRNESVPDRVILLGLDIKMFYGGPKEAVMHGIYRQNFGFTDIVIGRKHADAPYADGTAIWGDFDAQEIFGKLCGDLKIQPVKVGFAAFYESLGRVDLVENHANEKPVSISGKQVRETLLKGETVDPRIMRESTSKILSAAMKK
jgi:hypothetical protein